MIVSYSRLRAPLHVAPHDSCSRSRALTSPSDGIHKNVIFENWSAMRHESTLNATDVKVCDAIVDKSYSDCLKDCG